MKAQHGLALVLLLCLVAGAAAAEGVPTRPHEFWGSLTIDGSPAPAGTVVIAVIGDTPCNSITTTASGIYGTRAALAGNHLIVNGTAEQTGATVTFMVDGTAARQTAVFSPGMVTHLDLTVSGETTPTPKPPMGSGNTGTGTGGHNSPAPAATQASTTDLLTSSRGEVLEPCTLSSNGNFATLFLDTGVTALDGDGDPITEIGIVRRSALPSVSSFAFSGHAVDCSPEGATFDPHAVLTFHLTEDEWNTALDRVDGDLNRLVVQWYNTSSGAWEDVRTSVDPAEQTVTATISHFSTYGIFIGQAAEEPVTTAATTSVTTIVPSSSPPTETGTLPLAWVTIVIVIATGAVCGYLVLKKR